MTGLHNLIVGYVWIVGSYNIVQLERRNKYPCVGKRRLHANVTAINVFVEVYSGVFELLTYSESLGVAYGSKLGFLKIVRASYSFD